VKSIKVTSDEQKMVVSFSREINRSDTAELAETVMTKRGANFFHEK